MKPQRGPELSRRWFSRYSRAAPGAAAAIADHLVIVENGEKVAEMTAEELEHIIRDGGRQVAA